MPSTVNLPEEIQEYIQKIIVSFPQIESVWLFGSRANERFEPDSDWDIMVFADSEVLSKFKNNIQLKHQNIDLFICYDGDSCENPRPDKNGMKKQLSLKKELKWHECADVTKYEGKKEMKDGFVHHFSFKAYKIWEKGRNWIISVTRA